MKKWFALLLVCMFLMTTAYAAEWSEGCGPAQPLPGVRKLDINKEMGYSYTYPRPENLARYFCDVLEIYLPREDIELGTGHLHLYDADGEIADIDFANPDQVELRVAEESELEAMRWGGGMCIEIHLPVSLKFDESYYVLMDLNCFTANNGKVSNYDLNKPDQWIPVVQGEYGISGLYYTAAPAPAEGEEGEEAAEAEETEEVVPTEPKYNPVAGDLFFFDLVLGGEAKTAVVFSENDSVYFDELEYTESCTVKGTITKDELDWGVVFLDENDETVNVIMPAWVDLSSGEEEAAAEEAPAEEAAAEEAATETIE